MFRKHFNRTFIAMFWGWCVCNTSTFIVFVGWAILNSGSILARGAMVIIYVLLAAFWSALLILAAWLLIFFPADLLVSESSRLRTPNLAATLGAIGGGASILAICGIHEANYIPILAAITGFTAALHVVLKHPRITILLTTNKEPRTTKQQLPTP